jgi:hypothetical protein
MTVTSPTNGMGKVFTTLTVINRADQILASRGMILEEEVRSITLRNVLVDTAQQLFAYRRM